MKKLPIGVNDFEEMIERNYYFVDKTLLIKDIIELPGKIKLITRPRRFGKTLNMNMIKEFFSSEGKDGLFEGLKIWDDREFVKEHYHRYPVIFVTFKEVKDVSWMDGIEHLKTVISNIVEDVAERIENERFQRWARKIVERKLPISEYMDSLRKITQAFHEDVGKKVIILIDEYDVPIEAAYAYRKKDEEYYEKMTVFMRNMLTAVLKDNPDLELGILTGVYRVAKESIFSGLNNVSVFTIFDDRMGTRFGFTEEEIEQLLKHYGLSEDREILKEWYGGYLVGERVYLYNPWSVINYIDLRISGKSPEKAVQPFWINTSSNQLIKEQIEGNPYLKQTLDILMEGKEVIQNIDPWLSLRELEEAPEGVWTLLVSGGYLNAKRVDFDMYSLKIPNKEILYFFKKTVARWLEDVLNVRVSNLYISLVQMMKEGRFEGFCNFLEKFIQSSLSYYDIGYEEPERVYKAFLLGMLSIAMNGYIVESEMESGYGRLDVVVYPKERKYGRYGVIFEVKRVESEKKLEEVAKEAIEQVRSRKYYVKVKEKGYDVIAFGVVFSGKKVMILCEKMR